MALSQSVSRSMRCVARVTPDEKCNNRTRRGNLCWVHLQARKGLRVRKTNHGLGLFAWRPFYSGENITRYTGQRLTKKQVDKKYPGDQTAQYVLCDDSTGLCVDANITTSGYGRFVNSFFWLRKRL